jgi:hypothetical protein
MKITFNITDAKIDELLGHAAHDWLALRDAAGDWRKGNLKVKFDREDGDEGEMKGRKTIGRAAVAKGIAAMVKEAPWALSQWLEGNDDMEVCDAAYQCIIFGKLVYG